MNDSERVRIESRIAVLTEKMNEVTTSIAEFLAARTELREIRYGTTNIPSVETEEQIDRNIQLNNEELSTTTLSDDRRLELMRANKVLEKIKLMLELVRELESNKYALDFLNNNNLSNESKQARRQSLERDIAAAELLIDETMHELNVESVARDNQAHTARVKMRLLQEYYRDEYEKAGEKATGRERMRDFDVDSYSDNEIVDLYENLRRELSNFDEMVRKGREIRQAKLKTRSKGADSDANKKTVVSPRGTHDGDGDVPPVVPDDLSELLAKFEGEMQTFTDHLNRIIEKLTLGMGEALSVFDDIIALDNELKEIESMARELISNIDSLKEVVGSMSAADINDKIKEIRGKLLVVKKMQVANYNARVNYLNIKIDEINGMGITDPTILTEISKLTKLSICDINIKYNSINYLDSLKYDELRNIESIIVAIQNLLKNEKEESTHDTNTEITMRDDLNAELMSIEMQTNDIEGKIKTDLSVEEIQSLRNTIVDVSNIAVLFYTRLETNKGLIPKDDYKEFLERIEDVEARLAELNKTLNDLNKTEDPKINTEYEDLLSRIQQFSSEVSICNMYVNAIFEKLTDVVSNVFGDKIATFEARLTDFRTEVEKKHTDGIIDNNQYEKLKTKLDEIQYLILDSKNKLNASKVIEEKDIFSILNGRIDGVNAAIDKLEADIEKLTKPIKREDRKKIDEVINRISKEITNLEKELESYKDEDQEKYEAAKKRLDDSKNRLSEISKKYRQKCPLLVKTVKSAKEFFKKHKKMALIMIGLAIIALIHATVGPILIPAIMHGNLMLEVTSPLLRGVAAATNQTLGSVINAKLCSDGIWQLANGIRISTSVAASSLLKGLVISGVGSTALLAPIIIAIKELVAKMKSKEKQDKKEAEVEKSSVASIVKDKVKGSIKLPKIKNQNLLKDISKKYSEYKESGKSFDDFVKDNNLTDSEITLLKAIDKIFEEEQKKKAKEARKGGKK